MHEIQHSEWRKGTQWNQKWLNDVWDVKGLQRRRARVNTNCHLPITFYTDSCIVSQVRAWLCVAVDNQSCTQQSCWSDPMLHLLLKNWPRHCLNRLTALQKQLHVFNGLFKDIGWRVCPADRWRRWGDGAWSGWCSAGGCSPVHNHLRLQSKMHTLEFTHRRCKAEGKYMVTRHPLKINLASLS